LNESTLQNQLNWVKAHQDKKKLYKELDIWGWMNCDADKIATTFCLQMALGEVKPIQEGFFEPSANVSLIVKGVRITSHYLHKIRLNIQGNKHHMYLQYKHGWSNEVWDSIEWKELKGAFMSLGPLKQIKTSKSIHGWLNTGCQKSKISPDAVDAHKCPQCLQPNETQEHILKCPHAGAQKHQYELAHPMMTNIIQNPSCRVQQVFESYVRSWLADSEPPTPDISRVPIEQ
jgi:hypothetical protein